MPRPPRTDGADIVYHVIGKNKESTILSHKTRPSVDMDIDKDIKQYTIVL